MSTSAELYAEQLGYRSIEDALRYIAFFTENGDWHDPGRWHERTTRRFLLAVIKSLTGGSAPNPTEATATNAPSSLSDKRRLDGE